ncbi:MAG TPA: hypothetical protein PK992_03860 [Planctomycetaceae bacterium]|nr:hypothetical protein [Planctomycetaceae bacterium]
MSVASDKSMLRSSRRSILWIVFVFAALLSLIIAVWRPRDFFPAWLAASMWPWSVCVGALALRLILVLTGGRWGVGSLPWLNGIVRLLPLTAVLFLPWAFGLHQLYSWTDPSAFAGLENVEHRQWYFQPWFVIARTVGYFALWSVLSVLATGLPRFRSPFSSDRHSKSIAIPGGQALAGLGLVALLVSVTWAAMDWVMSLDPYFMSTLFGALVGMGAMLCGLSMLVALYCSSETVAEVARTFGDSDVDAKPPKLSASSATEDAALPDLANLLLAFVMLWAYLSFSQFLIMWSGDLPIEASFYEPRSHGLWYYVTLAVTLGGFAIPFCCLMSHDFKRSPRKVGTLAVCLLFVRIVELWWMIVPHSMEHATRFNWALIPTAVLMICGWLLIAGGQSRLKPSVRSEGDGNG